MPAESASMPANEPHEVELGKDPRATKEEAEADASDKNGEADDDNHAGKATASQITQKFIEELLRVSNSDDDEITAAKAPRM